MTLVTKNAYIDKLDKIVDKYNKTYHITIKMKPADVQPCIYILTLVLSKMTEILN